MGLFKKKETEWHDEHGMVSCSKCGGTDFQPEDAVVKDEFFIWIKCNICGNTSASYKSCRDASIDWNRRNRKK